MISASARDYRVTIIRKVLDETVNNSNVLQNDDELKYSMRAGERLVFDLYLYYNTPAAQDLKVSFTAPAGATLIWGGLPYYNDAGDTTWQLAGGSGTAINLNGSGANQFQRLSGICRNDAVVGDLQFQFAQVTAAAADTKVLGNSTLICHRTS